MKQLSQEGKHVSKMSLEEAEALLAKRGTRNHKSMRKFALKHSTFQDGLTWFHTVFCDDEGFSTEQLEAIAFAARVLTWAAVSEAQELGLNICGNEFDVEDPPTADRLIMESAWTPLSPESCTNEQARQLVEFIGSLLRKKCAFLDSYSTYFIDCPDYEVRGLTIPKEAKPWAVIANDKRTGRPIWEYCTDHADAKQRRTIMRAHAYRFNKFEIMNPQALSQHEVEMREAFSLGTNGTKEAWPFSQNDNDT